MHGISKTLRALAHGARATGRFMLVAAAVSGMRSEAGATEHAQQPHASPPARGPADSSKRERWYGWQTIMVDAGAVMFLVVGISTYRFCYGAWGGGQGGSCDNSGSNVLLATSLGLYGFGPPLIHGAHGRWPTAAGSLGLRAIPFAVAALGSPSDGGAPVVGAALIAMAFDAAVLGWEPVPRDTARLRVAPVVDPHARSGALLVGGSF